jgi:hypothetical protein
MTALFLLASIPKLGRVESNRTIAFPICALSAAIVLTYSHHFFHFAFQFATNILVWACILILIRIEGSALRLWRESWGKVLIACVLALNAFTSIALTAQAVLLARTGAFQIDASLLNAYAWLDKHSQRRELVMADYENSNQIPQYTHNTVFCGYDNAVRFEEKSKEVEQFFTAATPDNFRKELLRQNAIRFIVVNNNEEPRLRGLQDVGLVHEVFRNQSTAIYYAASAENLNRPSRAEKRLDDLRLLDTARMNTTPVTR